MTDKERILTIIISKLYFTVPFPWEADLSDDVHFEWVKEGGSNVTVGDLVLGVTSLYHDWKIGFVDVVYDANFMRIREIGSNRTCDLSNEQFAIIRGLPQILEGKEYVFEIKVRKAFRHCYWHLFSRIDFHDDVAIIWVRERFGGGIDNRSVPYCVPIMWNSKTTIKYIREVLDQHGYEERKFGLVSKDEDWK